MDHPRAAAAILNDRDRAAAPPAGGGAAGTGSTRRTGGSGAAGTEPTRLTAGGGAAGTGPSLPSRGAMAAGDGTGPSLPSRGAMAAGDGAGPSPPSRGAMAASDSAGPKVPSRGSGVAGSGQIALSRDGSAAGIGQLSPAPGRRGSGPAYLHALREHAEQHSIGMWAARYLAARVVGGAANTLEAKGRDLARFIAWFVALNGHGEVSQWQPRDTRAFLRALEAQRLAPTTINRALATLRHFARFVHEQPGAIFAAGGLPTAGVRDLAVEEPDCRKLARRDVHLLFKAADSRVVLEQHGRARPRRNRALLALLYYTGLRVQEAAALDLEQRDGAYLRDVRRKGRVRSRGVYLAAECRRALDDYLEHERARDDPSGSALPLFLAQGGGRLARQDVGRALARIAEEASKHLAEPIHLHPHRLRHTFGAEYRQRCGSDTETAAALGHTGLQYVGRYVRRTEAEREAVIEQMYGEAPED